MALERFLSRGLPTAKCARISAQAVEHASKLVSQALESQELESQALESQPPTAQVSKREKPTSSTLMRNVRKLESMPQNMVPLPL